MRRRGTAVATARPSRVRAAFPVRQRVLIRTREDKSNRVTCWRRVDAYYDANRRNLAAVLGLIPLATWEMVTERARDLAESHERDGRRAAEMYQRAVLAEEDRDEAEKWAVAAMDLHAVTLPCGHPTACQRSGPDGKWCEWCSSLEDAGIEAGRYEARARTEKAERLKAERERDELRVAQAAAATRVVIAHIPPAVRQRIRDMAECSTVDSETVVDLLDALELAEKRVAAFKAKVEKMLPVVEAAAGLASWAHIDNPGAAHDRNLLRAALDAWEAR